MNIKSKENYLIVELEGEIDENVCSKVKPQIDMEYKRKNLKNIVFDFDKTTFIDSSALGMVLGRYKRVSENAGKVFITGAKNQVEKVLEVADINKLIDTYQKIEDVIPN